MVQIVENWSDVEGRIESVAPEGPVRGHGVVTVRVDRIAPVERFPDLLADRKGTLLEVMMRQEALAGLAATAGRRFKARVRRADLHTVYVHPDMVEITDE